MIDLSVKRARIYSGLAGLAVVGLGLAVIPASGLGYLRVGVGVAAVVGAVTVGVRFAALNPRLGLGPEGLVVRRGGKTVLLPAEAIHSVGGVDDGQLRYLVLSYDPGRFTDPSGVLRRYRWSREDVGVLRLAPVDYLPSGRIDEVRSLTERHLGEWQG